MILDPFWLVVLGMFLFGAGYFLGYWQGGNFVLRKMREMQNKPEQGTEVH